MADLDSPESTRGAVVYDVHQVRKAWPHLLDDDGRRLFDRVEVSDDDTLRADNPHAIYTAQCDVDDFAPFLSAAARAALHKHRLPLVN
ncbi:hypothetical protein psal_cds_1421 [Pandoravirus salinus]|uniref:Uncharacterized protein n=1 Tax=Pandoravirus salinus TaxID=1349410 RepID=S4W541_9VIRU|nr:hypothetical protein psal_cds_1421 [Pandoravirus salinus]AGO85862.1 hypothetical protein psal_cds_1421 [Pandoravirus salinus]